VRIGLRLLASKCFKIVKDYILVQLPNYQYDFISLGRYFNVYFIGNNIYAGGECHWTLRPLPSYAEAIEALRNCHTFLFRSTGCILEFIDAVDFWMNSNL
jgi:hypothetical protein